MITLSVAPSVLRLEPIREHCPECVRLRRNFAILILIGTCTHVQTLSASSDDWLRSRIGIPQPSDLLEFGIPQPSDLLEFGIPLPSDLLEFGPQLICRISCHLIVF